MSEPRSPNPPSADETMKPPRGIFQRPGGWALAGWLAVGTLLLGAGCVPWLLSEPTRLARVINRLLPELDADITIGSARVGWTGPIVLEDVHVLPRNGAAEPIGIARIEGSHGLLSMLLSGGDLGTFRTRGLDLHVIYRANRSSNLTGLFVRPEPSGTEGERSARRQTPIRVRVEIDDAVVRVDGPWSPEQWVSEPIDVVARLAVAKEGPWSEWTVEPVQLLSRAELKPSVAQGILAYIAPVLAEATRTAGLFSLRLDGGTFPVGDPAGGSLSGVLSMHAVDLGPGPLVQNLVSSLPIGLRPPDSIRIADDADVVFRLADRQVWHEGLEFGVPLAQPGRRLDIESSGAVGIDDGALDLKLVLPLPVDMPVNRPVLQALAGKSISVGIGGVLGNPKVLFDGSIRAVAGQVIDELIGGRRRPDRPLAVPRRDPRDPPPFPRPDRPFPRPEQLPSATRPDGPRSAKAGNDDPEGDPADSATGRAAGGTAVGPGGTARELDPTVGQVIDLVGGVLDEVVRRRAERASVGNGNGERDNDDGSRPRRPLLDRFRNRRAVPPAQ